MNRLPVKMIQKAGDQWDGKKVKIVKKYQSRADCVLESDPNGLVRWFYPHEIKSMRLNDSDKLSSDSQSIPLI